MTPGYNHHKHILKLLKHKKQMRQQLYLITKENYSTQS